MADFLLERGASLIKETLFHDVTKPQAKPKVIRFPSALFYAVRSGDVETVKVLMGHGAKLNFTDENSETLLHKAAEEAGAEMIGFLVANGLDLEARRSCDFTPLHVAAMTGRAAAVAELLRLGANPFAKDDEGSTPLDLASDPKGEVARMLRTKMKPSKKRT